ncbi:hypothetical protein [Paraburkholderia sp.]|nr:hypothetical protein [Paraburkholderia sp.]
MVSILAMALSLVSGLVLVGMVIVWKSVAFSGDSVCRCVRTMRWRNGPRD